jgi:hypothetical protein
MSLKIEKGIPCVGRRKGGDFTEALLKMDVGDSIDVPEEYGELISIRMSAYYLQKLTEKTFSWRKRRVWRTK